MMLAPPNHGSELVDRFGELAAFGWAMGPAKRETGTTGLDLPRATVELGLIGGDRSVNPIAAARLPGANDGKVSVALTRLDGMTDHIVLPERIAFDQVHLIKGDAQHNQRLTCLGLPQSESD